MTKQIIDIHSHFLLLEYLDMLKKHNALLEVGFPLPSYNYKKHLDLTKRCSIEWTLLSISSPHPCFKENKEESISMCHLLNKKMAQIKKIQNILDFKHAYHFQMLKLPFKRPFML